MIPGSEEKRGMDPTLRTLIFWLLAALFAVMTSIGGATAQHMVTQNDEIINRLAGIEASIKAQEVFNHDFERRIEQVERKAERR